MTKELYAIFRVKSFSCQSYRTTTTSTLFPPTYLSCIAHSRNGSLLLLKDAETTDCEWQEESFLLDRSYHQACRARTHSKKPHQRRHESVRSLIPRCPFYSYLRLCLTAHCGLLLTCRRKCMCQPPEVINR